MAIDAPPPTVGADTDAVVGSPRTPAPPLVPTDDEDRGGGQGALAELKVLDFMWVMAGPAATRVLADNGATVIRVESANRIETARTIQPFLNDEGGAENSGLYQNMNAGKLGITIDMSKPEARDIIVDLVRWADVVCESFSPKAMRSWGLSYEDLKAIKPDIIVASSCLFGQSGPLSELAGFGTMGASLSGFYNLTGWPDRDPAGCFAAYTDYISPRFLSSAILAAVDHRDRTGEGQYIDLSQAEASISFLAPAVLDYVVNGREADRPGNRHEAMAPHAVFPVAGDDLWITVACENDEQWRSLVDHAGFDPALADLDLAARKAREDELEELVAGWTADQDGAALEAALQDVGVAAHRVQSSDLLTDDPQLIHREHFVEVEHADHGSIHVEGARFKLSRTPASITKGGPTLGQHTFDVLLGILGYDEDRIAEIAVSGVLE
jgi:benzylsuccinate CoA-transferase BbsF subunit